MSTWNDGYISDIGYTYGYYTELNPQRLPLLLLSQGIQPPARIETACELGFGQGLSVNLHSAASSIQWFGTDFSPTQTAFAQEAAQAAQSGARLYDQSFADFCQRPDLPDFDYIALHGIWSWIDDANRSHIVDFVRRKLKVGGVLYVSYNSLPGWAPFAPIQHLLAQHGDTYSPGGASSLDRVQGALDFADRLLATEPRYAQASPLIAQRVKGLRERNHSYLAHEYFNRNWSPMYFADMARWLEPAKLQYAAPAHYLDAIPVFHLSAQQIALLDSLPNPHFRETVRDFMTSQQFRRDLWVKGARPITGLAQTEALLQQSIVLTAPRDKIPASVQGLAREATLRPDIYGPLLDLLADHQPRTLGDILDKLRPHHPALGQWLQAAQVLIGAGHAAPAASSAQAGAASGASQRLNQWMTGQARTSSDLAFLASPVTGGGLAVGRFQQLFLHARAQGLAAPHEWAAYAWNILAQQGHRIVKDGQALELPEDNLAQLQAQAQDFAAQRLPALQKLRVAD